MNAPIVSEADKKELEYLSDLIMRGQRGERVELTFCQVSTRLYCITKRIERQSWLNKETEKENGKIQNLG